MRLAVRLLALVALAPALIVGSSAFSVDKVGDRALTATIVGDASAYVALEPNPDSSHKCFATQSGTTGKVVIAFASVTSTCHAAGTGLGIGNGAASGKYSRYAFHDILRVTNKGTKTILVWANATLDAGQTTGALEVAKSSTAWSMTDSSYAASSATALTLTPGSAIFLGVRVNSGELAAGSTLQGTILVTAHDTLGA